MSEGPWAAVVAMTVLAGLELTARARFNPSHVAEETYATYYPAYDYGFSADPVCWRVADERICQPTPYLDVVRQTFPVARKRGERRVFTIGSSVSRGDGRTAYSNLLESDLRRATPSQLVRVINLSASSTGSARQLLRVTEALKYSPSLLLIHLHGENESKDERDRAYSRELHGGLGGMALESRAVVGLKKYYSAKTHTTIPAYGAKDATVERQVGAEAWDRQVEVMEANLGEMLRLASARGVPVILVGSGRYVHGFAAERDERVNAMLAARAQEGVQFFDTPGVLRIAEAEAEPRDSVGGQVGVSRRWFRGRTHYTRQGHRLLADALAPLVRRALKL